MGRRRAKPTARTVVDRYRCVICGHAFTTTRRAGITRGEGYHRLTGLFELDPRDYPPEDPYPTAWARPETPNHPSCPTCSSLYVSWLSYHPCSPHYPRQTK